MSLTWDNVPFTEIFEWEGCIGSGQEILGSLGRFDFFDLRL